MNIKQYGGASIFVWNRDYLFKVLTSGTNPPITNPKVALAFRQIDRKDFIPQKFKDSAYQDVEIDIGYGETLTRPTILGQVASIIEPKLGGSYLDIGTGTGFFACILGFLAGDSGKIYSIERVQWLWELAKENSTRYKDIKNIKFLYRDGMEGLPQFAPYDGIHVAFSMAEVPMSLKMQLSIEGKLVRPTNDYNLRVIKRLENDAFEEEIIPGFVFKEGKEGVA